MGRSLSQDENLPAPSEGEVPAELLSGSESAPEPTESAVQEKNKSQASDSGEEAQENQGDSQELATDLLPDSDGLVDLSIQPSPDATEGYVYDPSNRRDPFQPYAGVRNMIVTKNKIEIPLEPLQRYDLDQLKVVGIMWDVGRPRAVIADPAGQLHTVFRSQKLGRNNGQVAVIREGELVVVETFEDQGQVSKNARVLKIEK